MSTIATLTSGESGADSLTDINANFAALNADKIESSAITGKEDISNKSTSVTTDGSSDTKYPSVKSIKDYADTLVAGLLDYRGGYDASVNTFPATGGSGTAGAVMKGDMWIISVAGTLGGVAVQIGDSVIASIDTPAQTAGNWNILNGNISYVPEDVANKATTMSGNTASDTKYLSAKAIYDWGVATFAALAGSGDVSKVGTPVNNQVGVWTGDGTLEGDTALTFDTTTDTLATTNITATTVTAALVGNATTSTNTTGNAATVTTNANLTGPVTSVGNATAIADAALSIAKTSGLQSALNLKAPLASPTFTGTVTIPSPFNVGVTSVIATGVEMNYLVGVTSGIQAQINAKGVGNALTSNPLSQFANTTSAQLRGVLSDENGTGVALFDGATSPTFITPILGTPTSGNLANCTFPTLNQSTTGTSAGLTGTPSITVATITTTGNLELGHASDTTLSRSSAGVLAVEGVVIPSISSTNTMTNKRNQPRIVSAASYTTDTGTSLDVSTCDIFIVTAQAGALLFNAPSGTPVQGEKLVIRIKDNGTARALTWNSVFRAMGTALPSTTVLSKTLYLGFIYNSTDTKWDLIASGQEA